MKAQGCRKLSHYCICCHAIIISIRFNEFTEQTFINGMLKNYTEIFV